MDSDVLILGLAWYLVFLFSLTMHEAAHALAALKLGDPTAYYGGQVTLDPRPHIQREPIGMVLAPLVTYFANGWMMGWAHIPLDPYWALSHPRRASLVSAAGPAANLLLVLVSALGIRAGLLAGVFEPPQEVTYTQVAAAASAEGAGPLGGSALEGLRMGGLAAAVALLLSITFSLNLLLFVFNLIPFPPLDGSSVILLLLGEENARRFWLLVNQPGMSLAGLLMAWYVFPQIYWPVQVWALNVLYPGAGYQIVH